MRSNRRGRMGAKRLELWQAGVCYFHAAWPESDSSSAVLMESYGLREAKPRTCSMIITPSSTL